MWTQLIQAWMLPCRLTLTFMSGWLEELYRLDPAPAPGRCGSARTCRRDNVLAFRRRRAS